MAINFTYEIKDGILFITTSGFDETLQQVMDYGQAVLQLAVEHQVTRVLCDERQLEYRLGTIDTFELATHTSMVVPDVARLALVCRPQDLADGVFFENVAVNRGLSVKAFQTLEAAHAWVTEA